MGKILATCLIGCLIAAAAGCGSGVERTSEGSFSLLTYNVAGLPQGLHDDTWPEEHTPLISPLLNDFDLVLVQEDFAYHDLLVTQTQHPYQSEPKVPERLLNDGLNRFSDIPFESFDRQTWTECNGGLDAGSDCLADKGFSVASHELGEGIWLDVYNLHLDAGGDDIDANVRAAQVEQLLTYMATHSPDGPVVVAGDTNIKPSQRPIDADSYKRLLNGARLEDACAVLACGDDRIDRVLFRSAEAVTIEPTAWRLPEGFVDDQGLDLSDHLPVEVELSWSGHGAK